jgi:hypothetical protein
VTVRIDAQDGRILARVINLAARLGCAVTQCEMSPAAEGGSRIVASFSGEDLQLRRLGGQLARLAGDESATAEFSSG